MTPPPTQKHEWFCCEDCNHDGRGSCPVPEKAINTISDLKKFQMIVKITGCKHQQSSRTRPAPSPQPPKKTLYPSCTKCQLSGKPTTIAEDRAGIRNAVLDELDKLALHEAKTRSIKQGGLAFVEVQVWIESLRSTPTSTQEQP